MAPGVATGDAARFKTSKAVVQTIRQMPSSGGGSPLVERSSPSTPRDAPVVVGFNNSSSFTSSSTCFRALGDAPNPRSYDAQSWSSFDFNFACSGVVSNSGLTSESPTSLGAAECSLEGVAVDNNPDRCEPGERGFATPKAFVVWRVLPILLTSTIRKDAVNFILKSRVIGDCLAMQMYCKDAFTCAHKRYQRSDIN